MQVSVTTTVVVGQELRAGSATRAAAPIAELIARSGGTLFPQELADVHFIVEIEDAARGARLVEELGRCDGIVAVYPVPATGAP